jgi:SAM-dependent methyltransferase
MTRWYEELFRNYAAAYDREVFTQGTKGEADFIEKEAGGDKQIRILDIGCGTGRHDLELARRGYSRLVGVDLSDGQLARARKLAAAEELRVDFRRMDARKLDFRGEFDLALMICEGAFPLMETDEMNYAILQGAAQALRPGGKLILTTLSALFPLFHSVKDFLDGQASSAKEQGQAFDLMTFREKSALKAVDDSGNTLRLECDQRYYTPSEMTWLLKAAGFEKVEIFGARLGAFSREDPLTPDDFEMLVVALRQGSAP